MSIKNSPNEQHIDRKQIYSNLNDGILSERLYAFQSNIKRNRLLIQQYGGLSGVVDRFAQKHIIIAAAGHSLVQSFQLLKKIQNRDDVVIISVDMAYKALKHFGIDPHFAITCESTPRYFFSGCASQNSTLLAFSGSNPSTVRSWKGEVAFYNWLIREEPYQSLWNSAGTGLGYVATGSIVTTQALSLVMGLTPKSILLCGNDLGFYGPPYAPGASWYTHISPLISRFYTLETICRNAVWNARHYEINRGDTTYYTNNQFLGAKCWIEDLLAQTKFLVYDMSEPGLSGKFVEKIQPKRYEREVLASVRKKRKRR